jgi:hypothetical protein
MKCSVRFVAAVAAVVAGLAWGQPAVAKKVVAADMPASAASASGQSRISPHVIAARERALAASAPQIAVSPLTQHRPHHPLSSSRQQ